MVCLTVVLVLGSLFFFEEALSANLRACTSNEVFVNGGCVSLKKWGQECQVDEECSQIRATCQSNQCLCKQGVPLVITRNREVCDDFKMPTDQLIFHIWKTLEERTKPQSETNLGQSDPPNYHNSPGYPPPVSPPSSPKNNQGFSAFTDTERLIFFGVFVVILVCGLIACCRCLAICMDCPSRQSGIRARNRSRLRIRVTDESGIASLDAIRGFLPDYGRNIQTSSNPDNPPPYEDPPEYSLTVSLDNDKDVKENYGSCSRTVLEKQKNMDTTDKTDKG